MPVRQQSGGSGFVRTLVICLLLAFATAYLVHRFLSPAPETPALETPSPTPAETPPPTPSPTPTPTATPEPMTTPEPVPPETPTPAPLPSLSQLNRRQLPLQIKLIKPVVFAIRINGQPTGSANAPAGVMVRLIGVRNDQWVDVQFQQTVQAVPATSTDIYERVRILSGDTPGSASTSAPPEKFAGFAEAKNAAKADRKSPGPMRPGTLVREDFEAGTGWPGLTPVAVGTIDEAGSKDPSLGLRGSAAISSGPLPVKSGGSDLDKLTLAFSLSASAARPVTVRVESFDATKIRTGALETVIDPAAPDFYQRYALDLSTFKPAGTGKFVPDAPLVSFSFSIGGEDWKSVEKPEIRLDNVHYAKPAYYVSPEGSDGNDGRSEKHPFATPQKALDEADAGDIILLMKGTYDGGSRGVASFPRSGAPDAWITLKNYPGQTPTLTCTGWNTITIQKGSHDQPYDGPTLAYLEVRGLRIHGEGKEAKAKYPEAMNKPDARTNTNGIAADGRAMKNIPHHLRFADNFVEYCPAVGIGTNECDWVSIEGNTTCYNSFTTIYGTSGISTLGASNFDDTSNTYRNLIRNNRCYGNETREICLHDKRLTDGNGIIIDVNVGTDNKPDSAFTGRTLIQNNLSYSNGGGGIHMVRANHVDVINNTVYLNSASPGLQYSQIDTYSSDDVRFINNIVVAPVADVAAGEKPEPVNKLGGKNNGKVTFSHNLYFGGNIPPDLGVSDSIHDPKFVKPSLEPTADFHLQPGSPAISTGRVEPFMPFVDFDGKPRGLHPSKGAYEP